MTSHTLSAAPWTRLTNDWTRWRVDTPAWFYSAVSYAIVMALYLVAGAVDERTLYGVSVWTKPFKFALSIAVYFATLVLIAPYLNRDYWQTFTGRLVLWVPTVCALLEMAYITLQASLGEPSHFNYSTPFHATMYSLMGAGAVAMVSILVVLAVSLLRQRSFSDPLIAAIALGLFLTFLLGGGFGGYLGSQTSHWVGGVASDADGLWLVKWAKDGGDLRVAHFFSMHAMQVLPLFALCLPQRFGAATKLACVIACTCAYSAFTTMTFWQAIQAQPLLG